MFVYHPKPILWRDMGADPRRPCFGIIVVIIVKLRVVQVKCSSYLHVALGLFVLWVNSCREHPKACVLWRCPLSSQPAVNILVQYIAVMFNCVVKSTQWCTFVYYFICNVYAVQIEYKQFSLILKGLQIEFVCVALLSISCLLSADR